MTDDLEANIEQLDDNQLLDHNSDNDHEDVVEDIAQDFIDDMDDLSEQDDIHDARERKWALW